MLANPFYKGIVRWNEIETKGIHKPIITKDLWDRVQEVIKVRDHAGERKRKHPHHLRGTLYCGECGSKMSSMVIKNRAKDEYTYFYCLGQNRKNGCTQKYIIEGDMEKLVEDCFKKIQLPEHLYSKLKDRFEQELLKRESNTIHEQQFITRRMTKLADQRLKLMDAYYAGAVPLEVLKKEQTRISGELEDCQGRLEILKNGDDDIKSTLNLALDMASKCYVAYTKANPKVRLMFNQAFFKKVVIKNKRVSALHYTNLFALLFDPGLNKEDLVDHLLRYSNTYKDDIFLLNSLNKHVKKISA